mgnify:CR=1 FL=1
MIRSLECKLDVSLMYAAEHLIKTKINHNFNLEKNHINHSTIASYNYNYNKAIKFLEDIGICHLTQDRRLEIHLEKKYRQLTIKQLLLLKYIFKYLPNWHIRFRQGIDQLRNLRDVDENIYQCLKEVGIFSDPLSSQTKQLIKIIRNNIYSKESSEKKGHIGLIGENLTIQYEHLQTGRSPEHVSFYNNYAGYDVLSYAGNKRKRIEVKTSEYNIGYITWNEWKKALESSRLGIPHQFHLWDLSQKNFDFLAILEISDLNFIPDIEDGGHHFETYFINFEAFRGKFHQFKVNQIEENHTFLDSKKDIYH